MSDDQSTETPEPEPPFEETPEEEAARIDAFDLDHDGKVSFVEGARAQLGVVDAHLEELEQEGRHHRQGR